MSEFLNLIGSRIKFLRKEKGLTQEELAEKADLQYTYIGSIERGERNISLLSFQKVLEALDVSPVGFFSLNIMNIIDREQHKTQIILKQNELLKTLTQEELIIINQVIQKMLEFKKAGE